MHNISFSSLSYRIIQPAPFGVEQLQYSSLLELARVGAPGGAIAVDPTILSPFLELLFQPAKPQATTTLLVLFRDVNPKLLQTCTRPADAVCHLAAELCVDAKETTRFRTTRAAQILQVLDQMRADSAIDARRGGGGALAQREGLAGVLGRCQGQARKEMRAHLGDVGRLVHPLVVVDVAVLRNGGGVGIVFQDGQEGRLGQRKRRQSAGCGWAHVHARRWRFAAAPPEVVVYGRDLQEVLCGRRDGGCALLGVDNAARPRVQRLQTCPRRRDVRKRQRRQHKKHLVLQARNLDARALPAGHDLARERGPPLDEQRILGRDRHDARAAAAAAAACQAGINGEEIRQVGLDAGDDDGEVGSLGAGPAEALVLLERVAHDAAVGAGAEWQRGVRVAGEGVGKDKGRRRREHKRVRHCAGKKQLRNLKPTDEIHPLAAGRKR